jgi:HAD superfamily hydrolase (TIGR01509 family)
MIRGVIFDMDGTITVPYINWQLLRDRIGATPGQSIMDYIEGLPEERSRWANAELLKTEMEAAQYAEANDGIIELIQSLLARGIRLSVVTNNHRAAMRTVLKRYDLQFDTALAREDGILKPAPDLIHKALTGMDLTAQEVVTVGDGRYDIEACERAGVRCIYLTNGHPTLEHSPSVDSLSDVLPLIEADLA